jgi:hypothetical protein
LGGWFRNYGATGIYNQSYGNHFYAESLTYWVLHSSNGMVIKDGYAGTNKGYLYYDSSGFGLLHSSGGWTVRTTTSIVEVYGTFYAPNLYDSNDTNYYVNPAGTSVMNQINLAYLYGNVEPASSNNSSTSYSVAAIELRESQYGGSSAYLPPRLGFHWGGVVASQISVESSGRISIINNPGSGYESLIGSILYGNESVRGPIFYDTNNTGYYVDPNSTGDSVRCAGDIVAFYSDERLKDIEYNIPNAVEKIKTLNGFYFTPNELAQKMGYQKKREVGLSAQEVERVLPEIIKEAPIDARYKTIDYSKLVPLLVEAIKEQQTKIEELELFINNLKH